MKTRTHLGTIDISSKTFTSLEVTLLFLERFCKQAGRICKQKNSNILLIGVISNCKKNEIKTLTTGKRIATKREMDLHIHIIYIAEKFSTIEKLLRAYLVKNIPENCFIARIQSYEHLKNRIPYTMTQCLKFRTVNTCDNNFIVEHCGKFIKGLVKSKCKYR